MIEELVPQVPSSGAIDNVRLFEGENPGAEDFLSANTVCTPDMMGEAYNMARRGPSPFEEIRQQRAAANALFDEQLRQLRKHCRHTRTTRPVQGNGRTFCICFRCGAEVNVQRQPNQTRASDEECSQL